MLQEISQNTVKKEGHSPAVQGALRGPNQKQAVRPSEAPSHLKTNEEGDKQEE